MSFFERLWHHFGASAPADDGEPSAGGGDASTGGGEVGRPGAPADATEGCTSSISCQEALAVVYEYLDGDLGDVSAEEVRVHFDICGRCYPHLEFERSFLAAVRRGCAAAKAPTDLKAKVADLLAEVDAQG
jgi:anti-sigma factor (TIGR02949 family)